MKKMFGLMLGLVLLVGCTTASQDVGFQNTTTGNKSSVIEKTLQSGQHVTVVEREDLGPWLDRTHNIHIDSIAAIDTNGHGSTAGYIVIYRVLPLKAEK